MPEPNFFIVGAPKCGTTALAYYLSNHPDIFISNPKEPNFFLSPTSQIRKITSRSHYSTLFRRARTEKAIGEASVWYLYSEHARNEIAHYCPDAKIIIMLRNPVNFIASLHSQLLFSGIEPETSLEIAWEKSKNMATTDLAMPLEERGEWRLLYGELGKFSQYVQNYQQTFGKQNVLVILQEDFSVSTRLVYEQVLAFLQVPSDNRGEFPRINQNKAHRSSIIKNILWVTSRNQNLVKAVRRMKEKMGLGTLGIYKRLTDYNIKEIPRDEITKSLQLEMQDFFADDNKKLGFSYWRKYS